MPMVACAVFAFVITSSASAPLARAQSVAPAASSPPPAAQAADVGSLDGIIAALYASISGPKDAPRDWDRLRTLMGPNARFIPTGQNREGNASLRNWSVEEYIAAAGPGLMKDGFFEREIGRRMDRFGHVVHVMSVYDSRLTPEQAPFQRGINSIQLFDSGKRWYILSVMWDAERPDNPIPADRIGGKGTLR